MKTWIMAVAIMGLLLIAGVAMTFNAKSISAQTTTNSAIGIGGGSCGASSGCGEKCTAESNCGLASCGATSGTGSCGCSKK